MSEKVAKRIIDSTYNAPVIGRYYADDIVEELNICEFDDCDKVGEYILENDLVDEILSLAAWNVNNSDEYWAMIGYYLRDAILNVVGEDKWKELRA